MAKTKKILTQPSTKRRYIYMKKQEWSQIAGGNEPLSLPVSYRVKHTLTMQLS